MDRFQHKRLDFTHTSPLHFKPQSKTRTFLYFFFFLLPARLAYRCCILKSLTLSLNTNSKTKPSPKPLQLITTIINRTEWWVFAVVVPEPLWPRPHLSRGQWRHIIYTPTRRSSRLSLRGPAAWSSSRRSSQHAAFTPGHAFRPGPESRCRRAAVNWR